ncbi:MAG: helix-turn-helix transcriptional regulator [Polyangiaceae bacterium]|nr:helix-turn-helix transcriptional regulator [Polyangiaceae bacterium]
MVKSVGRRVAELRRAQGRTQRALAEVLGVSVQYVQRIEQGRENLTLRSLAELAIALDAPASALLLTPSTLARRRGRPRQVT